MLKESALFHFQRGENVPLLLILDRRCDPITPLLNQVQFLFLHIHLNIYHVFIFLKVDQIINSNFFSILIHRLQ